MRELRNQISVILVKNDMPTRQVAISELVKFIEDALDKTKKAFGNCELCYGKGYSTQRETYNDGHREWTEEQMLLCKCDRGTQLMKFLDRRKQQFDAWQTLR